MSATGRGARGGAGRDSFPTPDWLTEAILPHLEPRLRAIGAWDSLTVYEPACGEAQAIAKVIKRKWPHASVTTSDIVAPWNVDFLTTAPTAAYDLIITNPPFKLAYEFIQRAQQWKRTPDSLVVMLLRFQFLGSKKRAKWLRQFTPAVAVTPKRPSFSLNRHGKPGVDFTEYAWMLWPGTAP